jgi:hypothetical protein
VAEQGRGRHPIIETGTGNEDGQQQASRIDQQMPLPPGISLKRDSFMTSRT